MKKFISVVVIVGLMNLVNPLFIERVEAIPAAAPVIIYKGAKYILIGLLGAGAGGTLIYYSQDKGQIIYIDSITQLVMNSVKRRVVDDNIQDPNQKIWKPCTYRNGYASKTNKSTIRYTYLNAHGLLAGQVSRGFSGYITRKNCREEHYGSITEYQRDLKNNIEP